jgi:G3E family GTPase
MKESYPKLPLSSGETSDTAALTEKIKKATEAIFSDDSCGNVIRIKGFFSLPEEHYLQLNASRQDFSLKKVTKGQEVLIVIGEDLKEAEIQKHFLQLS